VQTFLPYPSFDASAAALDRQRLGKQRVEVLQLLKALGPDGAGWRNHPAARMWAGHRPALCFYGLVVCETWTGRGYQDTCADKITAALADLTEPEELPPWVGDPSFHRAHQSNLRRKDPAHYGLLWPDTPPDLPYLWPELRGGGYVLHPGEHARALRSRA
jgi:hypothetical protein